MEKQSKINWLKVTLVGSVVLNIIFLAGYVALVVGERSITDFGRINTFQTYYCDEQYETMLKSFDETQDTEHAEQSKNVYAMTVCLKNYKTGLPLDLDPLIKQVEETPTQ